MSANDNLTLSDFGEQCIKLWEEGSLEPKLEAYDDGGGTWTIAFGCTEGVYKGMKITADQAEAMFQKEIAKHVSIVRKYLKRTLLQNEVDTLISFTFNEGYRPTVFAAANGKDYKNAVPKILVQYNKARNEKTGKLETWDGLVDRRSDEIKLWHGTYQDARITVPAPYVLDNVAATSLPYAADPAQKPSRTKVAAAAVAGTGTAVQFMPSVSDVDKMVQTGQHVRSLTDQIGDLSSWLWHSPVAPFALALMLVGIVYVWLEGGIGTSSKGAASDSGTQ